MWDIICARMCSLPSSLNAAKQELFLITNEYGTVSFVLTLSALPHSPKRSYNLLGRHRELATSVQSAIVSLPTSRPVPWQFEPTHVTVSIPVVLKGIACSTPLCDDVIYDQQQQQQHATAAAAATLLCINFWLLMDAITFEFWTS